MSSELTPENVCRRRIRLTLRRLFFLLHLGTIVEMMHK